MRSFRMRSRSSFSSFSLELFEPILAACLVLLLHRSEAKSIGRCELGGKSLKVCSNPQAAGKSVREAATRFLFGAPMALGSNCQLDVRPSRCGSRRNALEHAEWLHRWTLALPTTDRVSRRCHRTLHTELAVAAQATPPFSWPMAQGHASLFMANGTGAVGGVQAALCSHCSGVFCECCNQS